MSNATLTDKRSSAKQAAPEPEPLPDKPPTGSSEELHRYWKRRFGFLTLLSVPEGLQFVVPAAKEWLTPAEIAELKSLIVEHKRLRDVSEGVTPHRAKAELKALRLKYHSTPSPEVLNELETFDLEGRQHSYKQAHRAAWEILKEFEQMKLLPFADKLRVERFIPFVEAELAHCEKAEKALAVRMRSEYVPSAMTRSLQWTYAKSHFTTEVGTLLHYVKVALGL